MLTPEKRKSDRWPVQADGRVLVVFAAFTAIISTAPLWKSMLG